MNGQDEKSGLEKNLPDIEREEQLYDQFTIAMDQRDYQNAWDIYESCPDIILSMNLDDLKVFYCEIKTFVGEKQAERMYKNFLEKAKNVRLESKIYQAMIEVKKLRAAERLN